MEIKLSVKQPGRAEINFEFSCNAEETAQLIADPVYQELGKKLCSEISFKSGSQRNNNHTDHKANQRCQQQQSDRFDHFRRVMEADRKAQQCRNEAVDTAIKNLQEQLNRMFNRVINNSSITKF